MTHSSFYTAFQSMTTEPCNQKNIKRMMSSSAHTPLFYFLLSDSHPAFSRFFKYISDRSNRQHLRKFVHTVWYFLVLTWKVSRLLLWRAFQTSGAFPLKSAFKYGVKRQPILKSSMLGLFGILGLRRTSDQMHARTQQVIWKVFWELAESLVMR
jgi:hypothetical protein